MNKTFYILERVFRMTNFPVRYYDNTCKVVFFAGVFNPSEDPLEADLKLRDKIINHIRKSETPFLDFEGDVTFGGCKGIMDGFIIVGPVCRHKLNEVKKWEYAKKHNLSIEKLQIQRGTIDQLCSILCLVYNEITGKEIIEQDIISAKMITDTLPLEQPDQLLSYEMDYAEQEKPRFNYSEEQRFMRFVRNGDTDSIRAALGDSIHLFDENMVGNLAHTTFKQYEYMACSLIVLVSRAAIEGGINSLSSYLLADLYMQQLGKCTDVSEMMKLMMKVIQEYTERVRVNREEQSQSGYVEECKRFVMAHLNKPFQVRDISKEIGIDRTYLSKKFSQSEGIGIQQYARKKRVEAASNMLKYSIESILAISNYLCFTSQSYFGKVFKEETGYTPQQFRNKYQLYDFSMESSSKIQTTKMTNKQQK